MNRRQVLEVLSRSKPELRDRFALSRLALFGSFARDTADDDSDVDVIVEFDGIPTPDRVFGVQFYLEDILGRPVDLVTETALKPRLRPFIEEDRVNVR